MVLTDEERARLDPRVQVEWLERFLERFPAAQRAFVLNSFHAEPDPASMSIIGVTEPDLERLWHRAWGRSADGEEPTAF
jgi:hypothetical protein